MAPIVARAQTTVNARLDGELGNYSGSQMAPVNLGDSVPGTQAPAPIPCTGDCDAGGDVTINELITMVNVVLGYTPLSACTAGDADGSGDITINEIIAAVNSILNGCGTPVPTPTPVTHTVVVGPDGLFTFSPPSLNIQVGETVEWTWSSSGHNVVSGSECVADDQFCSPNDSNCAATPLSSNGSTYRHTFTAAGMYPYFCSQHCGFGMVGTVMVQ